MVERADGAAYKRTPTSEQQETSPPKEEQKEPASAKFECNICLEIANDPVVTRCGHLFCWQCILQVNSNKDLTFLQWMNQRKETLLCPVCKAGITKESVTPIYTRGEKAKDPREEDMPKRPQAERMGPQRNPNYNNQGGLFGGPNNGTFMMGFGIFPALFTLNFTWDNIIGNTGGPDSQNQEETAQMRLNRLLTIFLMFTFMSFTMFGSDIFLTY